MSDTSMANSDSPRRPDDRVESAAVAQAARPANFSANGVYL
jgi:hypothetical protein